MSLSWADHASQAEILLRESAEEIAQPMESLVKAVQAIGHAMLAQAKRSG